MRKKMRNYDINCDSEIHHDGLHYYLLIPEERPVDLSKQKDDKKIIALDPGVRTFQTGFHDNMILECKIDKDTQDKYYKRIQKLQSLRDKKKIKNPKKRILKLFKKIKNITDETHYKLINYLTENFNDILLPSFESQNMMQSNMLSRNTKRNMNFNQHYRFKQRLKERCKSMLNTRLHEVNESYTSKTCPSCGNVKHDLGSNKIYRCVKCGCEANRDHVGARNIFLKYICQI